MPSIPDHTIPHHTIPKHTTQYKYTIIRYNTIHNAQTKTIQRNTINIRREKKLREGQKREENDQYQNVWKTCIIPLHSMLIDYTLWGKACNKEWVAPRQVAKAEKEQAALAERKELVKTMYQRGTASKSEVCFAYSGTQSRKNIFRKTC